MIYYIGPYINKGNPNNFVKFPSSSNKMDYIISALQEFEQLRIISIGESYQNNMPKDVDGVYYLGTINKKYKIIARIYLQLQLIYYLLFKIPIHSRIIFYHTYLLVPVVRYLKYLKNVRITYEVEEIYNAAWEKEKNIEKEIKFVDFADSYILVNDLLPKLMVLNKQFTVCYGDYRLKKKEPNHQKNNCQCVYAGFIGDKDSDVFLAIDAIDLLPMSFTLNIAGYGSTEHLINLEQYIQKKNMVAGYRKFIFHGLLSGDKYHDLMGNMDIGLNTRKLDDGFSDYTFPSKVMVYLGYGLKVVSSNIKCVNFSKIADELVFFNGINPNSVANAVIEALNKQNNPALIVQRLHKNFVNDLKEILK